MEKLAREYKTSKKYIAARIKKLDMINNYLASRLMREYKKSNFMLTTELEIKIANYENTKCYIKDRIRSLNALLRDIDQIIPEIENYFEMGWWRSEEFTFNQRKSRKFVYSEPCYDESLD